MYISKVDKTYFIQGIGNVKMEKGKEVEAEVVKKFSNTEKYFEQIEAKSNEKKTVAKKKATKKV